MRISYDSKLLFDSDKFIGVNLGADFCAEHECGINGIKEKLEIDSSIPGVDGMKMNCIPKEFYFDKVIIDKKKYYVFLCLSSVKFLNITKTAKGKVPLKVLREILPVYNLKKSGIAAAWDDEEFGFALSEKYEKEANLFYKAFIEKDIIVSLSGGHVFKNNGLTFIIYSVFPQKYKDDILKKSISHKKLLEAVRKSKIEKLLERKGKRYLALSPKWKDSTEKEIIFWLNPYDETCNYGWFSLKDLKNWAHNKGPIIKRKDDNA